MSFDIRTPYPSLLAEVTDRDGQTIYQGIRLSGRAGELQHIEVASFSGPKFGRWGGANDGIAGCRCGRSGCAGWPPRSRS